MIKIVVDGDLRHVGVSKMVHWMKKILKGF